MFSRLTSIIRKEFLQILRDRRTLEIVILIPIIQLFILGYSATSDIRNVPLAVFDQCKCSQSRDLLGAYRNADFFQLTYDVASHDDIRLLIEKGEVMAGMIIPPDFDLQLLDGKAEVAFILDGSNATAGSTALSAATLIGQSFSTDLMVEKLERTGLDPDHPPSPSEIWMS